MERIEDRSKALSYIGIEVADALKTIPTPVEEPAKVEVQQIEETKEVAPVQEITQEQVKEQELIQEQVQEEQQQYIEETTFETKPSLWQRIKNSKVVRAIRYITKIRIVVKYPDALPEGRGENY